MYKKDVVLLCVLLGALVWACQLLSPPGLIIFGALEIAFAIWWGRRPRPKERIIHHARRRRIYDMP